MIAYKIELNPTPAQAEQIRQTIGVCRYIYNFYLEKAIEHYNNQKSQGIEKITLLKATEFSKWLNNEFLPNNPDYSWIKKVGENSMNTKSVRKSMMNAETAFIRFFKGLSGYPRFKKKGNQDTKMYLDMNGLPKTIIAERHRVKVPCIGWIRLKEKGYIPTNKRITGGTISYKAGRYYISLTIDEDIHKDQDNTNPGIGIDLGISSLAITSNGTKYKNINKTQRIKKLRKKLTRQQRSLSRKLETNKKSKKKGEATTRQNIAKNRLRLQRIYTNISNIQNDYTNKVITELVRTKPAYITIEDLDIKRMLRNKHLSKAIQQQSFYTFRTKLTNKCKKYGIELRVVTKTFPSSKTCSNCGNINKNLTLSDRTYNCPKCGITIDRDINAAINLKKAITYKTA